jgi:6-phosphofructokinase 2
MTRLGFTTLTMNPAVDVSTSVGHVVPIRKLRCAPAKRDAGGGGINVARVLRRFGSEVLAIYVAGGPTGELLRRLVDREGIVGQLVPMAGDTREDFTVVDEGSGEQYRFVLPGPPLSEEEWKSCLSALETRRKSADPIVVSGSLPPAVPVDFYGRVARWAKETGTKVALDTSGAPLSAALEEGVFLVKPNLGELRGLTGLPLADEPSWLAACRGLVQQGRAQIVALTLAERGALVVSSDHTWRAEAPPVQPVSTVGAGDSFLGAMVWSLASGDALEQAVRYGVAAGTAALLSPGTELCRKDDVDRLLPQIALRPM